MQKCPETQGNPKCHKVKRGFFPFLLGPLYALEIGNRDINKLFRMHCYVFYPILQYNEKIIHYMVALCKVFDAFIFPRNEIL